MMLEIKNLHASIDGREILKGIDLVIPDGEVHAVMGPNGSGKSTMSYVLAGRDGYQVTAGSVRYRGQDLLALNTEERARLGVFLAFQYPVEIPGVTGVNFLKTAVNAVRRSRGESELDAMQFLKLARKKCKELGVGDRAVRGRRPVDRHRARDLCRGHCCQPHAAPDAVRRRHAASARHQPVSHSGSARSR